MMKNFCALWTFILFALFAFVQPAASDAIKTVGASGADYSTIQSAIAAINAGTLTGAITLQIIDNTTETTASSLNASGVGSASYTSVTVYPTVSGLSITGNKSVLLTLNGASNVTIDGRVNATGSTKDLIIEDQSTTGVTLQLTNASYNTIQYVILKGAAQSSGILYMNYSGIVTPTTSGCTHNLIDHCDFTNTAGTRPMAGVYSAGNATYLNTNNTVSNCRFYDIINFPASNAVSLGLFLQGNNDEWTINNNSFFESTDIAPIGTGEARVISVQGAAGKNFYLTNNAIGGSLASCGGSAFTKTNASTNKFTAIYLSGGNFTVTDNTVQNISWSQAGTNLFYGIYFSSAGTVTASNNTIGASTGTNSITVSCSGDFTFYGIQWSASGVTTFNNNVIGAIALQNTGTYAANFTGLYGPISTANNNLVGSLTTANSISTPATAGAHTVQCLWNSSAGTIEISGNTFANITNGANGAAGSLCAIKNQSGVVSVKNNTIRDLKISTSNTTTSPHALTGIFQQSTAAGHEISGNTIYNLSNDNNASAGYVSAIQIYNGSTAAGSTVDKNVVYGLSAAATTTTLSGIYLYGGTWNCSNNNVSLGEGMSVGAIIYGIYERGNLTTNIVVAHNSVDIRGTVTGVTSSTYALYNFSSISARSYVNNLLINERSGGTTGVHYSQYLGGTSSLTNNYNDYYAPSGVIANVAAADKATLGALRTATGQDANSANHAVTFVSSTDLHLSGGSIGDYALTGTPLASVTTDFDGDVRNTSYPYMGMDENTSSVLPVEIVTFTAHAASASIVLNWKTATETNNYGFDIERKLNDPNTQGAGAWMKLGFINGMGTTNAPIEYSYTDASVNVGSMYSYRLKQTDRNGAFTYSSVVETAVHMPQAFSLEQNFPNPFNPTTTVSYRVSSTAHVSLIVYDILGRVMATLVNEMKAPGVYTAAFDATHLPSGTYFYRMNAGSFAAVKKLQLVK